MGSNGRILLRLARWMTGAIFIVAALGKASGVSSGTIVDDWSARLPPVRSGLIACELGLGMWLLSGVAARFSGTLTMAAASAFLGVVGFELTKSDARPCGCLGSAGTMLFAGPATPHTALRVTAAIDVCILVAGAALVLAADKHKSAPATRARRLPGIPAAAHAFTIAELLVVIGIIGVLIGLLFPVLGRMRERAKATQCASNLHQISQAFAGYCAENRGVTPRYGLYNTPGLPLWLEVIPPHLAAPKNFDWSDLPKVGVLQCPSHPTEKIPSGYVLNAFAFETAPAWDGSPPVPMSKVRNTAGVAWLMEAADMFGPSEYLFDAIFFEPYHIVRTPDQLLQRVHPARHGRRGSNVLFADGHVDMIAPGDLKLDMLDDGIRQR